MKSIYTLAAVAMIAAAGSAQAQTTTRPECARNQAANAAVIARAQAATSPARRQAILQAAIDANPANAVCIADLALQMSQATNVNPAAGPEEFGAAPVPTTTDGGTPPAENPNQLNQRTNTQQTSPGTPAL